MTSSAGQWWTETRAGGAELSCWRHETLEGPLGAAHEDPSSPAGTHRGALWTGASWRVPAPSLGLASCPGGEQPPELLGAGTWGAGSPQAGTVPEEGGNAWLPVGTPCPGLWGDECGSAGQGGAGAELSAGCRWGVRELCPHPLRQPQVGVLVPVWGGRAGVGQGEAERSARRGRQRGPAAGASSSSWLPAGSPLPPSHDWSGGAALPHPDTGQPGQFAVPAARSAFCPLPHPSRALPSAGCCHPQSRAGGMGTAEP